MCRRRFCQAPTYTFFECIKYSCESSLLTTKLTAKLNVGIRIKSTEMRHRALILLVMYFASAAAAAAEFKSAVGFGTQFGGVLGWQGSAHSGNSKLHLSIGIFGASLGYNHSIKSNVSIGVQGFAIVFSEGAGLNANYYFTSTSTPGWMIGLDVYRIRTTFFNQVTNNRLLISVGYNF